MLGLYGRNFRWRVLSRNRRQVLISQQVGLLGRDIACKHHRNVVGRVIGFIKSLEILLRPVLDVRGPADNRILVGVGDIGCRHHLFKQAAIVVIVYPETPLGIHCPALRFDDVGVNGQVCQAVSFELEDRLERRAWKPVHVNRCVIARAGIVCTARSLHGAIELALSARLRAVEHHVFEKVCDAGDARILIAGAGAYKVVHGDIRNVMVWPDDDPETIRQLERRNFPGHFCAGRKVEHGLEADFLDRNRDRPDELGQKLLADDCRNTENGQHGHRGVKFLAGLVNDRLRLVYIDAFLDSGRRNLINPCEDQGNGKPDDNQQQRVIADPRGQPKTIDHVVDDPHEQPAGYGVQQGNLEDVASPEL